MATSESIPVGVVLERRKLDNPWQEWEWRAAAVIPGAPDVSEWKQLTQGEGWTQFHAATLPLELHRKETEAYIYNLESPEPSIFIVVRENEDDGDEEDHPMVVHLVTASPYEAQDYLDSGEETVDAVAIPDGVRDWIAQFIDVHHEEETFVKRQRDKVKLEDQKFGKDPIFEQSGRVVGGAGDER